MKKAKKRRKAPLVLHMALGLAVAVIATTWYWSDLRGFYTEGVQAAAVLLGF